MSEIWPHVKTERKEDPDDYYFIDGIGHKRKKLVQSIYDKINDMKKEIEETKKHLILTNKKHIEKAKKYEELHRTQKQLNNLFQDEKRRIHEKHRNDLKEVNDRLLEERKKYNDSIFLKNKNKNKEIHQNRSLFGDEAPIPKNIYEDVNLLKKRKLSDVGMERDKLLRENKKLKTNINNINNDKEKEKKLKNNMKNEMGLLKDERDESRFFLGKEYFDNLKKIKPGFTFMSPNEKKIHEQLNQIKNLQEKNKRYIKQVQDIGREWNERVDELTIKLKKNNNMKDSEINNLLGNTKKKNTKILKLKSNFDKYKKMVNIKFKNIKKINAIVSKIRFISNKRSTTRLKKNMVKFMDKKKLIIQSLNNDLEKKSKQLINNNNEIDEKNEKLKMYKKEMDELNFLVNKDAILGEIYKNEDEDNEVVAKELIKNLDLTNTIYSRLYYLFSNFHKFDRLTILNHISKSNDLKSLQRTPTKITQYKKESDYMKVKYNVSTIVKQLKKLGFEITKGAIVGMIVDYAYNNMHKLINNNVKLS